MRDEQPLAPQAACVDRVHETFDELVDSDVDAIGVFTPPWAHAEQSIRALEMGKAVICACPAALTLDELRRLVDAVERTGRIYMTCETSHRFLADEFVRAVAADARPHNHVWIAARYCAPGIVAYDSFSKGSEWLEVPDFGSPVDRRKELGC